MATSLTVLSNREVIYKVELTPGHQDGPAPPEQPGWMTPLLLYMKEGKLPEGKIQIIQIKNDSSSFRINWSSFVQEVVLPASTQMLRGGGG